MTKEYLKMADSLVGEVFIDSDCLLSKDLGEIADFQGYSKECRYIAHAINSHDELVAEVDLMRKMIFRMGMYLELSGERPEKESCNPMRQWLYDSIEIRKK